MMPSLLDWDDRKLTGLVDFREVRDRVAPALAPA
jgi:hypothetical protein